MSARDCVVIPGTGSKWTASAGKFDTWMHHHGSHCVRTNVGQVSSHYTCEIFSQVAAIASTGPFSCEITIQVDSESKWFKWYEPLLLMLSAAKTNAMWLRCGYPTHYPAGRLHSFGRASNYRPRNYLPSFFIRNKWLTFSINQLLFFSEMVATKSWRLSRIAQFSVYLKNLKNRESEMFWLNVRPTERGRHLPSNSSICGPVSRDSCMDPKAKL